MDKHKCKSISILQEILLFNVTCFFNKLIGKNQKKEVLTDNIGLISKFYNGLHNEGQFTDFINLAKGLLDGKIKWHNMAWTGALHMGWLSACTTTCNMKYDKPYVDFFAIVYLLFGGLMFKCTKRLTSLWTSGFWGSARKDCTYLVKLNAILQSHISMFWRRLTWVTHILSLQG